ncbi:hypothetical protein BpHYR1_016547 [Brachionus plicatilis]|uniref:Uncharacterized protein n=1 Tax=Brachionus plicatilis TaxID=10195 RepID=A0A3M7T375_BRAPC|nr:hypothetical protein BpHYR1_016547 [Brachionus plicatilis]
MIREKESWDSKSRSRHRVDSFCATGEEEIILANHLDNSPMPHLFIKLLKTTLDAPHQTYSPSPLCHIGKYYQDPHLPTFKNITKPVLFFCGRKKHCIKLDDTLYEKQTDTILKILFFSSANNKTNVYTLILIQVQALKF